MTDLFWRSACAIAPAAAAICCRIRQHRLHDELDVAIIVDRLAFERQILGHVDVDRPGAAFEGEIDRFLDDVAGL